MHYLIFEKKDQIKVEESILPLFDGMTVEPVLFGAEHKAGWGGDDVIITYLSDNPLRSIIDKTIQNEWSLGVLPHPQLRHVAYGLGISMKMDEAVKEIQENQEKQNIDLLYCNDRVVFQAVSIGEVFALDEQGSQQNFFTEVWSFFKKIRKLGSLAHKGFILKTDDEEIVKTSALGIITVGHARGSVVARRLVADSADDDGMLHALVLAPQNIFTMIGFLLSSLIPFTKIFNKIPGFMGYIKVQNLCVEASQSIDFTIDGEKFNSNKVQLQIKEMPLNLVQKSRYAHGKKDKIQRGLKVENLPKGEKREELIKYSMPILPRATAEEFKELFSVLRTNARLTTAYLVMMILSTVLATFGLFGNSSPVIIGAMILAPLMSPIVSFSMGVVRYDVNMLKFGFKTILIGTLVSLLFAALVAMIIPLRVLTSEISARLSPNLLDLGIAVASGIAAAYAHAKEEIAKTLAGVAIAVALVPPLAVAGIGIGWMDWDVFSGAFLLYGTNLAGIIMFSGLTFLILGFAPFRRARAGLIYTFIIIILVCIPLTFSFKRIMQEARITEMLEGTSFGDIQLNDVKVRFGERPTITLRLVSPKSIEDTQIQSLKTEIERNVGRPIRMEVITAIEFE